MRAPRILRVITRLNIGGPSTHVMLANRGLQARGYECLLVHGHLHEGEASMDLARFGDAGPRVYVPSLQRSLHPLKDTAAAIAIARIVRSFRPDIIHTHHSKAGLLGRMVGRMAGARLVHTYHGNVTSQLFGPKFSRIVLQTERVLGSFTDAVITISEAQRREILQLRICPPERVSVIELGLDLAPFVAVRGESARVDARRRLGIPADRTVLVFSGRLVPVKRVDWLLRSLAPLLGASDTLLLAIIGNGPERAPLEQLSQTLGLDGRVRFVGWANSMVEWVAAANALVIGSSWEGTPLAIIEGMAGARPSVVTDVGGVRDVVEHGRTGLVVDRDDPVAFARAVGTLASDPELRGRMGAAAAAASARFDADRLVAQLDALYRGLFESAADRVSSHG